MFAYNRARLFTLLLVFFASGCSQHLLRDTVASRMVSFNFDYASPWFMASADTDVMCAVGEGMGGIMYPMGPNIDPIIPMLAVSAGTCADEKSKEQELRYIRAMRENDIEAAQDARTMQKRWLALAAKRRYFGYQAMVRAHGEPGGECPRFSSKSSERSYFFGLLVGLQAFQADFATGGHANVPTDIVAKVIKGIQCLDNEEYWGMPTAVASLKGILLSAAGDEKEALAQGYAKLDDAAQVGVNQGVRMVQALQAQLYLSQNKPEKAKQIIRNHVASTQRVSPHPEYRLMDLMATRNIRYVSDKLWTQATGQRTPYGKLGTFWDDQPALESGLDIDDLL